MQTKATTDYALRCILYLVICGGSTTAEEIGRHTGITTSYARKVLRDLKKKNLVRSVQGVSGGYILIREPKDIRMIDIIESEERELCPDRFMEDDISATWIGEREKENVHRYLTKLQSLVRDYFNNTTIHDVLHSESE